MAWLYTAICLFDFILAPVIYMIIQEQIPLDKAIVWSPLTLRGGGFIHMSFGIILGISAWSRGQEKITQMQQATAIINTPEISSGDSMVQTVQIAPK